MALELLASVAQHRRMSLYDSEPGLGLTAAQQRLSPVLVWAGSVEAMRWAQGLADEGIALRHRSWSAAAAAAAATEQALGHVLYLESLQAPQWAALHRWIALRLAAPWFLVAPQLRAVDQVVLLELGAEDAVPSDLPPMVLAAKLRRCWRASPAAQAPRGEARRADIQLGPLRLRGAERLACVDGCALPLTEGEFEVLWLLAQQPGTPVSREALLQHTRGLSHDPGDRSMDSRVYRLRLKLAPWEERVLSVRTVRHQGYVLSLR
jgi:DNA-binding response OmpR family regulator